MLVSGPKLQTTWGRRHSSRPTWYGKAFLKEESIILEMLTTLQSPWQCRWPLFEYLILTPRCISAIYGCECVRQLTMVVPFGRELDHWVENDNCQWLWINDLFSISNSVSQSINESVSVSFIQLIPLIQCHSAHSVSSSFIFTVIFDVSVRILGPVSARHILHFSPHLWLSDSV